MAANGNGKSLESWIWDAACSIRDAQEAPKFKDFILPLIFTKSRLFKKVSGELELPVTWHIFRHSAATFCEALGMPLSDREKLLGHSKHK